MTHPPRVVSSRASWLITIALSLTSALAHATTCDVDADGDIDRKDYLAILADIGERASGPNDPRDADRNGRILSNDAQLCARRCTLALCDIPTNKAPIAKNDAATTALDTRVRINVIANDRDRDGRIVPKTVRIVTKPKHGKVTRHRNGTVTYSPAPGFRGRDRFRYTVKDNRGAKSNVATATVTVRPGNVRPGNVPPVANNDSTATTMNTPVTINVVANDTDANGNLDPTSVAIAANPANGAVVNNPNGTVTYTPSPGFFGTDSFTYNVKDTQGATSNVTTVTVGVNAAPTANAGPDANAVTGQPVTLDGSGSSDPNGDMITFSWGFLSTAPGSNLADTDIVNPTTPAPSFTPDVDGAYELELTVTDPGGLSENGTVVITAATPNVAPNADAGPDQNAEVLTLVNLDGSGSSDPDNGPVTPLTFQWTFAQLPAGSLLTNTDITNATSAQASFTPDVIGLYRLTLTVTDGDLIDSDDVDITVALPNVPPNADAGPDMVVQFGPPAETATLNGSVSDDPDDFPNPTLTFQWAFVSTPAGSTLINSEITDATTATASFIPDVSGVYLLRLDVFDGEDTDFDEVMVTANAAPVTVADAFDVDEDTPLTVPATGVLTNDTDANNHALTAVLDSGPSDASAFTLNLDGSFTYIPNDNFTGDDTFTYHANDGSADSNVATVTITVNEVNDPPVAVDDAYSVDEDNPLTGTSVLANDTDVENDALTAVLDTGPTNAQSFTLNPDGTFSYTPNADFFGTDTFTYHANDGNSDSNVATVMITVDAVNDAPSFVSGGNVTVLEDAGPQAAAWATGISTGPANESGQTVNFAITGNTNPGLFSAGPAVSSAGVLSGTSAPNAFGSATITLVLQDNGGTANGGVNTSGPQSFTITVLAVNDPPVATAKSHQTHSGIRVTIGAGDTGRLKDGATDVDDPFGDLAVSASFSGITQAGATIVLSDAATGTFTYNPPAGFSGAASFQYQVCDDGAPTPPIMCSALTTVSFTVTGPDLWFVDDSAAAGGTGRLTDPFDALSDLPGGRGNGDRIFVFSGTYGGHTLLTNENLIGEGSSGTFDSVLGVTVPVPGNGTLDPRPALGGTRPDLNQTVMLAGNSTVRGLDITPTPTTGLSGGAVSGVTVNEVSVSSSHAAAINLNGTGGSFTLTSVSSGNSTGAPDPASGIVLNNTTGSFTVTGTGTPGSGGTIQNTATGISLTTASNVSFSRMQLNDFSDFAIRGSSVVGFTMDNTVINGTNGNDAGADEGSVRFTELTGSATISNSSISGTVENNFTVINTAGTLNRITFDTVTFGPMSAATGDHALLIESMNSAVINTTVQNSTFTAARGTHINRVLNSSASSDTMFTGNTISNTGVTPVSGGGAAIRLFGGNNTGINPSATFNIANNTMRDSLGAALAVNKLGGSGSFSGTIANNTVGVAGVANSGSSQGSGIFALTDGTGSYTASITGNTVRQYGNFGIFFQTGGSGVVGSGAMNVTATGNTVSNPGTLVFPKNGVQLNGGVSPGDTYQICLSLGGAGALANAITGTGTDGGTDFRLRQRQSTTMRLPGYAGANNDEAAVVAFVQGNNDPVSTPTGSALNTVPTGGGFVGSAACPLP